MNISPAAKHNLTNVAIILLPTLLAYVVYYLGGGNFTRDESLGGATFLGIWFSAFSLIPVSSLRGWK